MTTTYQARLVSSDKGLEATIEAPEDKYLLDISEEEGMELPFYRSLDVRINSNQYNSLAFGFQKAIHSAGRV